MNGCKIERAPIDGPISVHRVPDKSGGFRCSATEPIDTEFDDLIKIDVSHDGKDQSMRMTEYNARRVLGALSLVLQLPLSKAAQKEIVL